MNNIYALFIDPIFSFMPLLWFLHTLFLIFLFYYLVRNRIKNTIYLFIIFVLINVLLGKTYPGFGRALANIPYFALGVMLREETWLKDKIISGRLLPIVSSLITLALVNVFVTQMEPEGSTLIIFKIIGGCFGSVCVTNIAVFMDKNGQEWKTDWLVTVGFYSMTIYLVHTFFVSTVRIMYSNVPIELYMHFELGALIAIISGICFPVLLEKRILRKNGLTRKYILGLSS